MKFTRFAILPDDRCLMLGKDEQKLFEPGVIYEVVETIGETVIKRVGQYALSSRRSMPTEFSTANDIISCGFEQMLMTPDELKAAYWYQSQK